jgi:hypothetical protein
MNGTLPDSIAHWLGAQAPEPTEGMVWQLESMWHWAPWATVLLVVAIVALTTMLYARESCGASAIYRALLVALRLTAMGLLLIMLAQWAIVVRVTGPPAIALVVDDSASMGIVDTYDDQAFTQKLREQLSTSGYTELSRINQVKSLLTENDSQWLRELAQRYRLEVYRVAAGLERVPQQTDPAKLSEAIRELRTDGSASKATRLGDGLLSLLAEHRDEPPAAVVILSDGVTTEGVPLAEAANEARRRSVPVFTVGLGRENPQHDIELADVVVDDVVFANDRVHVQAIVKASGLEGQPATVTLRREGVETPVAQQSLTLPPDGKSISVQLVDRPTTAGQVKYVVEIAARDDEPNKQNNRHERTVSVRDDKIRVLLAFGYPSYEFRFLKSLLERDSTIKLSTYLQDADPSYAEQDKTALRNFPIGREELFEYDVVLLSDVDPRLLPEAVWANLRAFVAEKGGGLLLEAGPKFIPQFLQDNVDAAALLPIEHRTLKREPKAADNSATVFSVRPTALGLENSALQLADTSAENAKIWSSLAPLYWAYSLAVAKPAAHVLAEGAGPLIVFQYFGAGRVEFLAIDSTWRWRAGAGNSHFARLWLQTIRYLARGKLDQGRGVQLVTDRREYRRGEAIQLRARFFDPRTAPANDEAVVVVESAGQDRRRVVLRRISTSGGLFEATLLNVGVGQYDVLLAEPQLPGVPPTAHFSVVAPPGEFAKQEMDAAALQSTAATTRGKFYRLTDANQLLRDLPPGRAVPLENLPPFTIWNRWWLLAGFLSCLTAEWFLRKRKGMM